MKTTIIIPNRRDKDIEPHCLAMFERFKCLEPEADVIDQPSPALIDFFRSEATERAFLCGADVLCFFDSDCSCDETELIEALDESRDAEKSGEPLVQTVVFASKLKAPLPPEQCFPIGRFLEYLKKPLVLGQPIERQTAPSEVLFGAACVIINKSAWLTLCDRYPLKARALSHMPVHLLWKTEVFGGEWLGEDFSFFRRCHQAGIPVVVEPMRIGHGYGDSTDQLNYLW